MNEHDYPWLCGFVNASSSAVSEHWDGSARTSRCIAQ